MTVEGDVADVTPLQPRFMPRCVPTTHTSFFPTRCFNEESCLSLKPLEGYLVVLQPDAPQISLSGVGPHLARPAPEFEGPRGVPLFPELRIVCSLSHAVNTAAQGMEGGGESDILYNVLYFLLKPFIFI